MKVCVCVCRCVWVCIVGGGRYSSGLFVTKFTFFFYILALFQISVIFILLFNRKINSAFVYFWKKENLWCVHYKGTVEIKNTCLKKEKKALL